jgi:hypothetical protein
MRAVEHGFPFARTTDTCDTTTVPPADAAPRLRDLLNAWDPIGVEGANDDEYDCLIPQLLTRLGQGADAKAISAFLFAELVDHFGLDPSPGSTDDIAERIAALR